MDHYTLSQRALRVPATLVFGGVLLSLVVGLFHADGPANDHAAAFAEYAHSGAWIAVHLGQFVGMMVIVAGLLVRSYHCSMLGLSLLLFAAPIVRAGGVPRPIGYLTQYEACSTSRGRRC